MITLTREEAQQVLDALDGHSVYKVEAAIEFLRARLSAPEPEPAAWIYEDDEGRMMFSQMPHPDPLWEPVYRKKRNWVGLTDEEIMDACSAVWASHPVEVGRVVEAKLKEKNT